jgi:hypothetical protein
VVFWRLIKVKVDERFAVIENIDFTGKMEDKKAALRRVPEGLVKRPLQGLLSMEVTKAAVRKTFAIKAD